MLGKSIAQILRLSGVFYMLNFANHIISLLPREIKRNELSEELSQFLDDNDYFQNYSRINSESVQLAIDYVFHR